MIRYVGRNLSVWGERPQWPDYGRFILCRPIRQIEKKSVRRLDSRGGRTILSHLMDKQIATGFLKDVFSRVPAEQWISIFAIDRTADQSSRAARKVLWNQVGEIDELVDRLEPLSDTHCIWYGVATRPTRLAEGRGGADDCALIPAMWADLDVTGPGHHSTNLPPTQEAAAELLLAWLPTSMIVQSGGGLQPYWLLDDPVPVEMALPLLDRWYYTWQQGMVEHGWHLDNVFDPARILRLPGTFNMKDPTNPRPVTLDGLAAVSYPMTELVAATQERPKVAVAMPTMAYDGPERAGDHFNRVHRIDEVLQMLGFHSPQHRGDGVHWTRPGKEGGPGSESATVFHDAPDKVTIFSSTCTEWWPAVQVNKPYDAFGLLVAAKYDDDFSRAAEDLRREGYGDEFEDNHATLIDELEAFLKQEAEQMDAEASGTDNGWDPIDLTHHRYRTPPPPPDLFARSDDTCLLYRRRIHYFFGPPESGKSWGSQVATAWVVIAGDDVTYIDFENDPWSFGDRMRALGVSDEALRRIAYFNPSGHYTDKQWETFKRRIKQAQLVVVDGVSNGMNLFGYNPMEHKGAVDFEMNFLRPLTAGGAAVVAIDHTPKNTEHATVFGAQHKKAAVTGAMFRFEIARPFGRGLRGVAKLYLEKDKPGYLRQHTEAKGLIAELVMDSLTDGTLDARLNTPTIGGDRPTQIMERLSIYAQHHPGVSLAELKEKGTYSTYPKLVQKAVEILLEEGFLQRDKGKFYVKRPYRDGAVPFHQLAAVAPTPPAVPGQLLESPQLSLGPDDDDVSSPPVVDEEEASWGLPWENDQFV